MSKGTACIFTVGPSVFVPNKTPSFLLLPTRSGDAAALREMKGIPPSARGWREWERLLPPRAPTLRKSRGRDVRKPRGMPDRRLEHRLTHYNVY